LKETFSKEHIEVEHIDNDLNNKNKRRHKAIKEHFEEKVIVPKDQFIQHVKDNINIDNKEEKIDNIQQMDFSYSNPRNNQFINELAFHAEVFKESLLELFGEEVNEAVKEYKKYNNIIEQKKDNGDTRAFIGRFEDDKLKRFTKNFANKKELDKEIQKTKNKKHKKKEQGQSKAKEQSLSLERKREGESS